MKMRIGKFWGAVLVAAAMLTAGAGRADASIIVLYTGTSPNTNPTSGGFTFTYDVYLGPGESLDTTEGLQFFTVYDFYGFTGVQDFAESSTVTGAGGSFSFSSSNTGLTPTATCCSVSPADDPNVANLSYTYSGGLISNPITGSNILLGTLAAESTVNLVSNDSFTAQTTVGGELFANIGTTQVTSTVPEPGSMFLLGSGLLGLASLARRRVKNTTN